MPDTTKSYRMFGATVELALKDGISPYTDLLLDDTYKLGLRLQKIFNMYDGQSELSRLNEKRKLKASPEMLEVLSLAIRFSALTNGQYDVAKGKQFLQRKKGQSITPIDCSYKDIEIKDGTVTLLHKDVLIDLGSVAKGYIADRMAAFMKEQGAEAGYVDARGDIMFFGEEIAVGVKHPRRDGNICTIRVKDLGVATSGDYMQYNKDFDDSHIFNKKDIISATTVAHDLTTADIYASLLMVCENDRRKRLLENTGVKAMTIDRNLNIEYYNGFEELLIDEA